MNDLRTTPPLSTRGSEKQRGAERLERPEMGDPGSGKVQMERLLSLLRSIQHGQEPTVRAA